MTNVPPLDEQQILELLAGKVLGDLTPDELAEFEALDPNVGTSTLEDLELTAAAAQLVFASRGSGEDLPESIRKRVQATAGEVIRHNVHPVSAAKSTQQSSISKLEVGPRLNEANRTSISPRELLAWLACAASLLLALGLWQSGRPKGNPSASLSMARAELVEQATDLLQIDWAAGTTPFDDPVTGDVVWSNERQEGFMRFASMPANDPSVEQYQLWIIDPARDEEPIDGGVFNIPASGEVIVPINAKLRVLQPAAFAITIEKPGGVVVSDQSRLPLLAAVR